MPNLFGLSEDKNVYLTKAVDDENNNDNAIPLVGENYAIVESEYQRYHIAHVIFQDVFKMIEDGNVVEKIVNITLEANRGYTEKYNAAKTKKEKKKYLLRLPYFDCYSTTKDGPQELTTFHSTNCCGDGFPFDDAITIVLKPKGDKVIMEEEITPTEETKKKRISGKGNTKKKLYKGKTKKIMSRKRKRT